MKAKANIKQSVRSSFIVAALFLCSLAALPSARAQVNLTNGLWAYYGFNDGTASNNTAGGPVGTIIGNPVVTNGWFQNALFFDGVSNSVNCGYPDYFATPTVSAYVMLGAPLSSGTEQHIVNHSQGNEDFTLRVIQTNNNTYFSAKFHPRGPYYYTFYNEIEAVSLTSPIPGRFYHVTLTFDGATLCLYVNGVKEAQTINTGGWYYGGPTAPNLSIGSRNGSDSFFNGIIDEVYIYTRALSLAEIQQLETPPLPPYIVQQPVGVIAALGSNATFNVSATAQGALPLFYQWQRNGTNLVANSNLVGVASSFLSISNIQSTNLGFYSVVITNVAGSITSSCVLLGIADTQDDDADGIPNWWENTFGLNANNPNDATNHPTGDKLTYLQKYLYGLDPFTIDTDGDGVSDYDELFGCGTNPQLADSDGDGIPDGWEIQYGLNPSFNDSSNEAIFNGVSYLQIYQYNLTHTNQLDPRNPSYQTGKSNFEIINGGGHTNRFYYDHNDRLLGMESSSGISIAYTYDGNSNLKRQTVLSRVSETNGLPVLWQYLNGLTNGTAASGANGDPDGDGWSNYQELLAGSNPNNSQSTPLLFNNPGTNIGSLILPFTPSNFVVGTGNLDGYPGDEIIVGADGNPSTNINFLLVLTQNTSGWSTQRVDVGSFGITSIAIGQPTNRPSAGIYLGLRGATNGSGRLMEFICTGGVWQSNVVAVSTNQAAFVLGVQDKYLFASLGAAGAANGAMYAASYGTNWNIFLTSSNTSQRGLGTMVNVGTNRTSLRLLDAGGIEVNGSSHILPTNAIYRAASSSWYFPTPTLMTWSNAEALAQTYVGHLASIADANENEFVRSLINSVGGSTMWIGLNDAASEGTFVWSSGEPSTYVNWAAGEPNGGTGENFIQLYGNTGQWNDLSASGLLFGVIEVPARNATTSILLPEPIATRTNNWRGVNLDSGLSRGANSNSMSIFYSFTDDKNHDGLIDYNDDFVTAEYLVAGTNVNLLTLFRKPIASITPAQSYGLASVVYLNNTNETFFTGEPDGQVFAWTATDTTNPLQRQLFSAHYAGKAWQALMSVKTLNSSEGLGGLMVDPANQKICNVIFWQSQSSSLQPAAIAETAPSAAVIPSANPLGSNAVVIIRLWDNEGDASTPFLQFQILGSTTWQNASLTALDGAFYSLATHVTALPTGINHTLIWNALGDLGGNIVTNVLLRARAQDFMLMGDWSMPTPFQLNTTVATISNPTNPPVNFTGFTRIQDGIGLNWQSGSNAWLYLQRSPFLAGTNAVWVNIWTGAPPTSFFGSYTDFFGTNLMEFYRMKIVSP